jgi:hypothetical protein
VKRVVAGLGLLVALAGCDRAQAPADAASDSVATTSTAALPDSPQTAPRSGARDAVPDDTRVLPLAFRASESLESLQARFGAANVRVEEIPVAEGEMTRGAVLFPDDPSRRAYVHFVDSEHLTGLSYIRIVDPESTWSLGEGLRMGTTLAELVARNGAPIEFSGFGWDYGGAIAGFRGGALEPRSAQGAQTGFRLSPRPGLDPALENALPNGDTTFSSDDPQFADIGTSVVIGELTLAWPRPARD